MVIASRLRLVVRRARNAATYTRLVAAQRRRWRAIRETRPREDVVAVSYGRDAMAGHDAVVIGGAVKFELLARTLPNAPFDFNVLYLGSSSMPIEAPMLARLARRRGAAFVWNQNGVAYRGWYGDGYELANRPAAKLLHAADHVIYQSAFCKLAADTFYGARGDRCEVLHNPVDTTEFRPDGARPSRPLTLLLGGSQYQRYRVESALDTLVELRRERSDARLVIAGALSFAPDAAEQTAVLIAQRGLVDVVELAGPYRQADGPALMHRADVLLHPKYNDPCPTVVLEAMACGLPVVYSNSGGTPELVGDEAGVGVPAPLDWERDHPPAGDALAEAVLRVVERLDERSAVARERSLRFDARGWVARHVALFAELTQRSAGLS